MCSKKQKMNQIKEKKNTLLVMWLLLIEFNLFIFEGKKNKKIKIKIKIKLFRITRFVKHEYVLFIYVYTHMYKFSVCFTNHLYDIRVQRTVKNYYIQIPIWTHNKNINITYKYSYSKSVCSCCRWMFKVNLKQYCELVVVEFLVKFNNFTINITGAT